ncbi:MAG: 1,4-dihydroxy-6-naphthoate synthase [Chitinophagaceae bacterium]|nr:1,4-dihydroxy-6-naphthoate synthase [Chitinophagaceae bacterium]MCA6453431.1 1,4-dihydroxy-6-naphthoate synthase [Chitinophagaceae bacterium]MCA6459580.1 1,4-dihydroxy-6-naphthoate synthase [Chitinophagaceae bacterium]MCA6464447.1 1,4-dihydroxy-6-naphthoate synthase [Chitinophagaceae bacterium]MEA3427501.1 1,4-dihydroxy-6-naphthoate synthase [Bacteroidota bacterium]
MTLAFSPCPNDTFIFDALVNGKIDTEGISFDVVLEDVQTLNEWAKAGKLDISKISYGVLPLVLNSYKVLNSGGALGMGVGPLLISKGKTTKAVEDMLIAIPGENTTAHMLFSLAYPNARNKQFLVFHEIEEAVLSGRVDAGVIIHENRFTYQDKGLYKIRDLGEYWEETVKVPIPLGGIIIRKDIDPAQQQTIDKLIRKSLEYAFANYPQIPDYVHQHSQEMSEQVMRQHIDLYVNQYSLGLGDEGKKAVNTLLDVYQKINNSSAIDASGIFVA